MADFVNDASIKRFITEEKKMRSSGSAVKEFANTINEIMIEVINISAESAVEDKRSTIMIDDVKTGLAKAIQKKDLNSEEIFEQLIKESPADLGKITKGLQDFVKRKTA